MSLDSLITADSPLMWWKLDETSGTTAADSGSAAVPGTYNNTPVLDQISMDYGDLVGKAVFMDGINQDVSLGADAVASQLNGLRQISFEFVARQVSNAAFQNLFEIYVDSNTIGLLCRFDTGSVKFFAVSDAADSLQTLNSGVTENFSLYHVVCMVDFETKLMAVYINGALSTSMEATFLNNVFTTGTPTAVDSLFSSGQASGFFHGRGQHFAIYNRLLSDKEIRDRYRSVVGFSLEHTHQLLRRRPSSLYPLNEPSGNPVEWISGNQATLNGATQSAATHLSTQIDFSTDFDGVDDNVTRAPSAGEEDIFAAGGTFCCWIKADTLIIDGARIWAKDSSPGFFLQDVSAGAVKLGFVYPFSTTGGQWDTTTRDITLGQLHHVAVTYDASNVANNPIFYIDGEIAPNTEATAPVGTAASDAGLSLIIGNRTGNDRQFDGTLSQLAFWRRIIAGVDIRQIYIGGYQDAFTQGYGNAWRSKAGPQLHMPFGELSIPVNFADFGTVPAPQTIVGSFAPALRSLVHQDPRGSVRFNGTDTQITVGTITEFTNVANTRNFTIVFNIRILDISTDLQCVLSNSEFSTASNGFVVMYRNGTGTIQMQTYNGVLQMDFSGPAGLNDGLWHNIIIVSNGAQNNIYMDGVAGVAGVAGANAAGNSSFPLDIGFDGGGLAFLNAELQYLHISGGNLGFNQARQDQNVLQMYEVYKSRYAAEVISKLPQGYWRLNEAAGSAIDYGNDVANPGTFTGGPGLANSNTPISNEEGHTSTDFDGVNDYVDMGNMSTEFTAIGTGDYTMMLWIRPTILNGVTRSLFNWRTATTVAEDYASLLINTSDVFRVSSADGAAAALSTVAGDLTVDQWAMVAVARNTGVRRQFSNTVLGISKADTVDLNTFNDQVVNVGRQAFTAFENYYQGQIVEVAFFEGTVGSADLLDMFEAASISITPFVGAQGNVVESLLPNEWTVDVLRADTLAILGSQDVDTDLSVTYSINFEPSGYTGAIFVLFRPKTGSVWQPSTAYSLGDYVLSADPVAIPHFWVVTTAGTTGSSEPAWNLSGTTADGSAVWTYVSSLIQPIMEGPLPPINA